MKQREGRETFDKKLEERTVREVLESFEARRGERRLLERGWELNMNFLAGNQYCGINPAGELEEEQPRFAWQYRRVFNHIAPAFDTRCAKLARVRPSLTVRAATGEESDQRCAKIATNALRSVCEECGFNETIARATVWSETCGTAFYKVLWDARGGRPLVGGGESGREGAVRIAAVPPFELYPENLACERIEEQPSIIHAKVLPVSEIEERYGVRVAGRDICEFSLSPYSAASNFMGGEGAYARNVLKNSELVVEYYQKPCRAYPNGRLLIVAGDRLVHSGDLPYKNGENGTRTYPFVRQCALPMSGAFFGGSVIDRMIPVQRAFNAVKNRKHEFLNRLTMGVLAVEDGSLDTQELCEEGLAPGKVLVYRQGSQPPAMLGADSFPAEFQQEEARLLDEFVLVSGVSEISATSRNNTNVTSATGLQLLIDQDDTRLAVTTDSIKQAMIKVGRQVLRLLRQFATEKRLMRMTGEGKRVEMYYFRGSDLSSDDVVFETDNDETDSPTKRRSLIYELYNMGLLADENGKVSDETRERVLNALGFGGLEAARGLSALHANKAAEENRQLCAGDVPVDSFDDDSVHIAEHTRFVLSDEFPAAPGQKERFAAHIAAHEAQRKGKAPQNNGADVAAPQAGAQNARP